MCNGPKGYYTLCVFSTGFCINFLVFWIFHVFMFFSFQCRTNFFIGTISIKKILYFFASRKNPKTQKPKNPKTQKPENLKTQKLIRKNTQCLIGLKDLKMHHLFVIVLKLIFILTLQVSSRLYPFQIGQH